MTKLERTILHLAPIQFLVHKSKKIRLPGFQGLPLYDVIVFFIRQVQKIGFIERAAAISFRFMLAIPPATIFFCTLIPYLPGTRQITTELFRLTNDIIINKNVNKLVKDFLHDFLNTPRRGLLSLGFFLAVFYSSSAVMGIIRSFNRSLVTSRRNGLTARWMAIKLTSLLIVLVLITIGLLTMQGTLFRIIMDWANIKDQHIRWLIKLLRWGVIIALIFYMVAFIYKFAPAVKERWRLVSPGAILATSLIILTTGIFSSWVNRFGSYNKIYGSIGTILIIMLLIYFNSLVLLIGYELNVSIYSLKTLPKEKGR